MPRWNLVIRGRGWVKYSVGGTAKDRAPFWINVPEVANETMGAT